MKKFFGYDGFTSINSVAASLGPANGMYVAEGRSLSFFGRLILFECSC